MDAFTFALPLDKRMEFFPIRITSITLIKDISNRIFYINKDNETPKLQNQVGKRKNRCT